MQKKKSFQKTCTWLGVLVVINLWSIFMFLLSIVSLIVGIQNVRDYNWFSSISRVRLLLCVCSVRPSENNVSTPTFFPVDSLQKKLKELEEENKSLRSEVRMHTHPLLTGIRLFYLRVDLFLGCVNRWCKGDRLLFLWIINKLDQLSKTFG